MKTTYQLTNKSRTIRKNFFLYELRLAASPMFPYWSEGSLISYRTSKGTKAKQSKKKKIPDFLGTLEMYTSFWIHWTFYSAVFTSKLYNFYHLRRLNWPGFGQVFFKEKLYIYINFLKPLSVGIVCNNVCYTGHPYLLTTCVDSTYCTLPMLQCFSPSMKGFRPDFNYLSRL